MTIRGLTMATALSICLAACGGDATDDSAEAGLDELDRESPGTAAILNEEGVETDDPIEAAIGSPERSDDMRARDDGRRPGDILRLSGIGPGDRVVELGSFGNYYSILLADVVGPDGELIMLDPTFAESFAGDGSQNFADARDNATFEYVDYGSAELPDDVDAVFLVLFYHDLVGADIDMAALNSSVYDALGPGGTYLVIDHKAADGSGARDAAELHRIDPQFIIDQVTAAGFELEEDSDLLANADDDRTAGPFSMRGETDRAVLLFRKPG